MLVSHSPLAGEHFQAPGLDLQPAEEVEWALLVVHTQAREVAMRAAQRALGLMLPHGPRVAIHGALTALWFGPDRWLIMEAVGTGNLATRLAHAGGQFDIVDLSGERVMVTVSGTASRQMLRTLVPIDLDPRIFGQGGVASTLCCHCDVLIWQLNDAPSYQISTTRSYARSLWHGLVHAAESCTSSEVVTRRSV